jgi:hypothetical protein
MCRGIERKVRSCVTVMYLSFVNRILFYEVCLKSLALW